MKLKKLLSDLEAGLLDGGVAEAKHRIQSIIDKEVSDRYAFAGAKEGHLPREQEKCKDTCEKPHVIQPLDPNEELCLAEVVIKLNEVISAYNNNNNKEQL